MPESTYKLKLLIEAVNKASGEFADQIFSQAKKIELIRDQPEVIPVDSSVFQTTAKRRP